jgi:hypothetical protein
MYKKKIWLRYSMTFFLWSGGVYSLAQLIFWLSTTDITANSVSKYKLIHEKS